jgi:ABC-type maltose transport system permease subunit
MIGYIANIVALEQKEIVARGYSSSLGEELEVALALDGAVEWQRHIVLLKIVTVSVCLSS